MILGQAKAAETVPAEQNQQTEQNNNGLIPQGGLMELLTQYWYIPAGLMAVLVAIGFAKKK